MTHTNELPKWLRVKLRDCKKCGLHRWRRQVVTGKGDIPADILFMGEAPGKTENLFGAPFVGPSGRLLDVMIADATTIIRQEVREDFQLPSYFVTNTILCRPTDGRNEDNRSPHPSEVAACGNNVMAIYAHVQPRIVVFIGRVAERYYKKEFPYSFYVRHPSFLLRQGGPSCDDYGPAVRTLSEAMLQI